MKKHSYIRGKIHPGYLIAAFAVALAGVMLVFFTRSETLTPYADVQLAAAQRMQKANEYLKERIIEEGIPLEADLDPNETYLVGPEWTPLTTTLGHLEAKRSALNPNYAALLVYYFKEAGLEAGDTLAVGTSGSFPGLAIATFCAAEEMGLDVKCSASFGSSMYGGTRPEFTTIRMLEELKSAGIISYELLAISPGGTNDYGESMLFPDSRGLIHGLAAELGVEYIDYNNIEKSIARRVELFGEDVDCFVNVGGASVNSGTSAYTLNFPNGVVIKPPRIPTTPNRGLMYEYAARGVPVVNMLNVRQLCADHGLPYDPVPMPEPGEGGVYYDTVYSRPLAILTVLLCIGVLAFGHIRYKKRILQEN